MSRTQSVEDLVVDARAWANELKRVPGRNEIMRRYGIGAGKASRVRESLVDQGLAELLNEADRSEVDRVAVQSGAVRSGNGPVEGLVDQVDQSKDARDQSGGPVVRETVRVDQVDQSKADRSEVDREAVRVVRDRVQMDRVDRSERAQADPDSVQGNPVPWSTRAFVWVLFAVTITLSVAANVAHSYVPPVDAASGWRPEVGAVVASAVWPVLLYLTTEVLARVRWPGGWHYLLIRWGGIGSVALVAGIVSYRHMSSLLAHYGEDAWVSTLGPIGVDGAMALAAVALLVMGQRERAQG